MAEQQVQAPGHLITYFVNGEREETREHKLTVRAILTAAGFTPAENYRLQRDEGHHTFTSYDEEVPLRDNERFTAIYNGPTPTSWAE